MIGIWDRISHTIRNNGGEIDPSHILTGGDPFTRGAKVNPGVFSALPDSNDRLEATDWNSACLAESMGVFGFWKLSEVMV